MNRLLAIDHVSLTATFEAGTRGPEIERLLAAEGLTLGHFPQSFEYATIGGFAATRSSGQSSAGYGRFDSLAAGTDAVRRLAQAGSLPTVIRLSDEAETRMNLASQTAVGESGALGCLMIVGHEGGSAEAVTAQCAATAAALGDLGGIPLGPGPGEAWVAGRFKGPYLRDSLLDMGVFVDTIETATYWSNVARVHDAVRSALEESLGQPTLVLGHISHVYATGCSLYFTVITKEGKDPLHRWHHAKAAASEAILAAGATISHHHGVGTDHRPWLAREVGPVGVAMLRSLKAALDPTGILNPGVLIP